MKSSDAERYLNQSDSIGKLNASLQEKNIRLEKALITAKITSDSLGMVLNKQNKLIETLSDSISVLKESNFVSHDLSAEDDNLIDYYTVLVTRSNRFMKLTGADFFYDVRSFLLECEVLQGMRVTNASLRKYDMCYAACYDLISFYRPEFAQYSNSSRSEIENGLKDSIKKVLGIDSSNKSKLTLELNELWLELRNYVFDNPYTNVREVFSIDSAIVVSVDFGGTLSSIVFQDYLIEKTYSGESIRRNGPAKGFQRD
jgi:hypothetical protein